jgi:hypothetical protein
MASARQQWEMVDDKGGAKDGRQTQFYLMVLLTAEVYRIVVDLEPTVCAWRRYPKGHATVRK